MPFKKIGHPPFFHLISNENLITPDEVFIHLTKQSIPEIYEYYMVSNYARIFNKYTNSFLSPQIGTDGYFAIRLMTDFGAKMFRLNRLVLLAFQPIPNSDEMVVNHIDCNPLNNHISNLEWVSRRQNAIHAYDHGLMKCGEDGATAIISNEDAIKAGLLLQNTDLTYKEIVDVVGNNISVGIVQNICQGRDWVRLMKENNIDPCRHNTSRSPRFKLSKENVHEICKAFEQYSNKFNTDAEYFYFIAEKLNCFGTGLDPDQFRNTLRPIYFKQNHKDIVSQYNF